MTPSKLSTTANFTVGMKSRIFLSCIVIFISSLLSAEVKAQEFHNNFPECVCVPAYIILQPVSPSPVCPNSGTICLSLIAGGTGPLRYKWKENGIYLSEGGMYSGTNTSTLTITNPTANLDEKIYQCEVANCHTSAALSNPDDVLIVQANATDVNEDGMTDNQDFSQLNLLYNTTCLNCREDINADGFIDVKDFLLLLGAFNTACQ